MTLSEILQRLNSFDEKSTIIAAKPWSPLSRAQVIETPESGRAADMKRDGMVYFLEVAIALEFKGDWPEEKGAQAFCERVIHYATHDA